MRWFMTLPLRKLLQKPDSEKIVKAEGSQSIVDAILLCPRFPKLFKGIGIIEGEYVNMLTQHHDE